MSATEIIEQFKALPAAESFYALSPSLKDSTRRAWKIFKENPFDPRLRSHKIYKLSARYSRTIYAAETKLR